MWKLTTFNNIKNNAFDCAVNRFTFISIEVVVS